MPDFVEACTHRKNNIGQGELLMKLSLPRSFLRVVALRIGLGLITLFVVSAIIFSAVSMLPGSFASVVLGQQATPEKVAALNKEMGLDKPAPVRYAEWIGNAARGDFGYSYVGGIDHRRAVSQVIGDRLFNTLFLAGMTAVIAVPLSIAFGLIAALYRGGWLDRFLNASTLTSISMPEFFVAYILIFIIVMRDGFPSTATAQAMPEWLSAQLAGFFQSLPAFPTVVDLSGQPTFLQRIYSCALPALTLSLVIMAHMMRMTRSAIINLLSSPFVEMARLKGASPVKVILRHALPNAWAPIAYVVAFNLAYLITGVVVVEVVFVYPGVGQLMVDAVRSRDIPVVQACALIFASAYIILNLCADIVTIATNPRLMNPR
jgi:peptide/nickel transport system permease protein